MYVKTGSEGVPSLCLRPPKTPTRRRKFSDWDSALETMLSAPISPTLEHRSFSWKRQTVKNADSRIDTSKLAARSKSSKALDARSRAKDEEMKSRQALIQRIVETPLSPRKRQHEQTWLSTKIETTATRKQAWLKDRHEVENVVHERQMRMNNFEMRNVRKQENMSVARGFGITVLPTIKTAFGNRY